MTTSPRPSRSRAQRGSSAFRLMAPAPRPLRAPRRPGLLRGTRSSSSSPLLRVPPRPRVSRLPWRQMVLLVRLRRPLMGSSAIFSSTWRRWACLSLRRPPAPRLRPPLRRRSTASPCTWASRVMAARARLSAAATSAASARTLISARAAMLARRTPSTPCCASPPRAPPSVSRPILPPSSSPARLALASAAAAPAAPALAVPAVRAVPLARSRPRARLPRALAAALQPAPPLLPAPLSPLPLPLPRVQARLRPPRTGLSTSRVCARWASRQTPPCLSSCSRRTAASCLPSWALSSARTALLTCCPRSHPGPVSP
eukprot:m.236905 g.236905  ORF g.236905 m.236905 type:complete len:314 (-) comp13052_c0_seq1:50-991(-)